MTNTLVKSKSGDFPSGITHHHLLAELIAAGVVNCVAITQTGDDIIIYFSSDYSASTDTINTVIANYKPVPAIFDDLKWSTITSADSPYRVGIKSVRCGSGNIEVLLPKSQRVRGGIFAIHKTSPTGIVTITPHGAETIGGNTSLQLTADGSYCILTNDGTNWTLLTTTRINVAVNDTLSEPLTASDILIDNGSELAPLHIGTTGQVLMVDSTQPLGVKWGDVAGGSSPACTEVSSSVTVTTTSSSYVVVNGMSTTQAAGSYCVIFSAVGACSSSSANIHFAIYVNGSVVDSSIRQYKSTTGVISTICTTAKVTGGVIDVRFRTSAGTYTVYNRSMQVLRVV